MNNTNTENIFYSDNVFSGKVPLLINAGRFLIKTITTREELTKAFQLRYQVFQVEMIGLEAAPLEDYDEFDMLCDHLAVFDTEKGQMVATCRLNSSLYSSQFYSESEFNCSSLINRSETKLEIGRVCVHRDFRKSVIIMLLWRAIAEYMLLTQSKILFGCGSVMTQSPEEAFLLFQYLTEENKVRSALNISPLEKYQSFELNHLLLGPKNKLTEEEKVTAKELLPPLCRSYFDIGCYISGPPAFDREFKCIDFFTILEIEELHPRIIQKLMRGK